MTIIGTCSLSTLQNKRMHQRHIQKILSFSDLFQITRSTYKSPLLLYYHRSHLPSFRASSWTQWHTPVIPSMREAERRITVWDQCQAKAPEILSEK
jgi:hypothetical protein